MVATTANSLFTKSVFLEQVGTMGSLPREAKYQMLLTGFPWLVQY